MPPADRIVLVQMPMGLVQVPNLGLSLLKAGLVRAGFDCSVRYFSLELLDRFITLEDPVRAYVHLVNEDRLAFVGASYFAAVKDGDDPIRDQLVQEQREESTAAQLELLDQLQAAVEPFLEHCLETEDWSTVKIVGFTTIFPGMTIPSAVLAGRLKERFPHLVTILGGWNTGEEMGEVILEKLPEFDYVLRGEADETFIKFSQLVLAGETVEDIPGLVCRDPETGGIRAWPQEMVQDMDSLPFPDFSDYFETFAKTNIPPTQRLSLPFETARGCWWGEIKHCTFCGLNGLSMPFRSKSPDRALAELDDMVTRYQPKTLFAADTIIDPRYFNTLLPEIGARHPDVQLAYEVKAPVRSRQMEALRDARVNQITVGIECLSSRLLHLLDKGTTYLQNVHCLRLAAEYGIHIGWQHLFGLPFESLEDYEQVLKEIPWLVHLCPPQAACAVTLARFSPYHSRPADFDIRNVRAFPLYRMCFPWAQEDLDRVAYYFSFEHGDGRDEELTLKILRGLRASIKMWQGRYGEARLEVHAGVDLAATVDTRFDQPAVYLLTGTTKRIQELLETPRNAERLVALLQEGTPASATSLQSLPEFRQEEDTRVLRWTEAECRRLGVEPLRLEDPFAAGLPEADDELQQGVHEVLQSLAQIGLVCREDDRFLSLAVPKLAAEQPLRQLDAAALQQLDSSHASATASLRPAG